MSSGLRRVMISGTAVTLLVGLLTASQVKGASILVSSLGVTPDGTNFKWSYTENLTLASRIEPGSSFFSIIDFNGYVAGSNFQPAGWTFSAQLVTSPISGTDTTTASAADSPSVVNLRWDYTGPEVVGPAVLGVFGADSKTSLTAPGVQLALDTNASPDSRTDVNSQGVTVPGVPLPATASTGLSLFGALGALVGLRKLTSRRSVA